MKVTISIMIFNVYVDKGVIITYTYLCFNIMFLQYKNIEWDKRKYLRMQNTKTKT